MKVKVWKWKCESESGKVKVWWGSRSPMAPDYYSPNGTINHLTNVKVKVWKWKCESRKVGKWKCESRKVKMWKWMAPDYYSDSPNGIINHLTNCRPKGCLDSKLETCFLKKNMILSVTRIECHNSYISQRKSVCGPFFHFKLWKKYQTTATTAALSILSVWSETRLRKKYIKI